MSRFLWFTVYNIKNSRVFADKEATVIRNFTTKSDK